MLAAAIGAVVAGANAVLSLLLDPPWYIPLIVATITFALSFGLYYYSLQQFIYRKLKIIYKLIYQTKATRKQEFFYKTVLPQKTIAAVTRDVERWAQSKKGEIEILRENERYRKEFLTNLAHELRTPIFTIQGYVETLLGGAMSDPAVAEKFLRSASKSTDRLVRLVDDLNRISKLESGHIPIETEPFVMQDLIREVFEEFELQAGEKGTTLEFKKGTERPLPVRADKPKIRQVVTNLVENALKYGKERGIITAGCYEMDGRRVYVEISDDGPGIAEEHLPRIFERFYRADRSRSRTVGGTGLGLAIVKHIVEAHGQAVTVRSTPGVGSSFGFTLEKGE